MNINSNYNSKSASFPINQPELEKQLALLGYTKKDTIYLRAFLPSNHPDKSNDRGRKLAVNNLGLAHATLSQWQHQKRGIYLVVNGGGHTDTDITICRAIFYEHDNLDKELQINLWRSLGLPEPTFQVDTGGKSIHNYWVFNEQIPVEIWRKLQSDLLDYADADRSLKNPSRVMRLAGCVHGETGQQSKIISENGSRYSFSQLRNIIPVKTTSETPSFTPNIFLTSGDVPLYQCLTKDDRSLIDCGQVSPGRNVAGAKLSRNLIGTAARLQHLGHRYEGQPRLLFDDFCSRCSPPLDAKEADSIWRSAQKDNPTPSLTDVTLENCVKAWHRQQAPKTELPKPQIKTTPTVQTTSEVLQEINNLVTEDLPKSELEILLSEIAQRTGKTTSDTRRFYEARSKEHQQLEELQEVSQQIPHLLKAKTARIDPRSIFWGDGGQFATLLTNVASSMPTSVENLITTLIPVAGSRIGTAARIVINPAAKYTQPAIFWSCVVAPTGRLKSPAQEVIISPLCKLEADEFRFWKLEKEDFEQELKSYRKNSDEEPPTPPPPRKRFLVQSSTAETRIKIHSENPRGLLNYRDEWSSFINGRNKYRNGKGDDLELDLSEFNGGAIIKDNSNESFFIERSSISRTGNTQPETLHKFLAAQDFEDYTGEFARWLFCLVPGEIAYIDLFKTDNDSGQLLEESLIRLYKNLSRLPERDYFLTNGAKGVFQTYHRWLTEAELAEAHPGVRAAYPKLKSYLARLALWLHIVNAVLAGTEPEQMISGTTMYAACSLTNFYLAQTQLLYNTSGQQQLAGDLLKIKEFIDKRDGVSAREIKAGVFSLRRTPTTEVFDSCVALSKSGLVRFNGNNKKFYPSGKTSTIINTSLETIDLQSVEGVDLGSTKINIFPHTETETITPQAVEGVDQLINSFFDVTDDTLNPLNQSIDNFPSGKTSTIINTSLETITPQSVEGVDPGSTKINIFPHTETETITPQAVEGVDQSINTFIDVSNNAHLGFRENLANVNKNTSIHTEKITIEDKSVDLVDQLLIKDQHPQQHLQQGFSGFVDAVDQFSEKQKNQKNSLEAETHLPQAIEPLSTDNADHKKETLLNNSPCLSYRGRKIEVGGIYLARSLKQQVKVTKTYKNKKADVLIKGDIASEPRLLFSDLFPLPAQPWSPNAGQLADYGGEWVEIVGFASGGKKFQVELASGKTVYVSKDKLKCPQV